MNEQNNSALEPWLVSLFLLAFLLFNVLTATLFPYPVPDECMIAEPAISYVHGQGFSVRFSEMLVTYSFLLVPWMKLFGASLRSIRSADIVCMTMAFFLIWAAVKRLGIVAHASWRLLLLFLLATEYGMIFSYRSGRYDGFGALLMASVLWLMSIPSKKAHLCSLFAICLIVPWAGLQYLPLLFTAGLVLVLIFGWRYWQEVATSFLASGLGGVIFLAMVDASGRLSRFLRFVRFQQRSAGFLSSLIKHGQFIHGGYIPKDFSFPFLFAAAILLFIHLRRAKDFTLRSAPFFGILFAVALSVVLILAAKFPTYYSYMIIIPLGVSVCSGLSKCRSVKVRFASLVLCVFSALAGAGLDMAAYAATRRDHDYSRIERFVALSLRSDDIAYVDSMVYLAARQQAMDAYFPNPDWPSIPLMSQEQRDSIAVLIVRPEFAADIIKAIGGNWKDTGEALAPENHNLFGDRNLGFLTSRFYDLHVYRRVRDGRMSYGPGCLQDRHGVTQGPRATDERGGEARSVKLEAIRLC